MFVLIVVEISEKNHKKKKESSFFVLNIFLCDSSTCTSFSFCAFLLGVMINGPILSVANPTPFLDSRETNSSRHS